MTILPSNIDCIRGAAPGAASIPPLGQFGVEIVDRAKFDRLNQQLADLDAEEPHPDEKEAMRLWCAKRRPLVEAMEATIRMGGRCSR